MLDQNPGNGLEEGDERVKWFWSAVKDMSPSTRAQVWKFATGRASIPKSGCKWFEPGFNIVALASAGASESEGDGRTTGQDKDSRFDSHSKDQGADEARREAHSDIIDMIDAATETLTLDRMLMSASTCFSQIRLPRYSSAEVTKRQLVVSVEEALAAAEGDPESFDKMQDRLLAAVRAAVASSDAIDEARLREALRLQFANAFM
jgi:hypothetical protein